MIEVSGLYRRFGHFTAVRDVSFTVEKGEVVGFLGPNGAGKTTTIRMLTGFLPASAGSIQVAGFDVVNRSLQARRRIGYLPEAVPLYRELRVEEMLRFQGRLHRLDRRTIVRRTAEVLDRVGLSDWRRSLVGKLSKGMRQRVGLAVALLPKPEILILDEPTSGLDPLQRLEVRGLVKELAEEHTVLFSSHILPEVEAVAPRVIILNQGAIAADGTPEALVSDLGGDAFVRVELEATAGTSEAVRGLIGELPGVTGVRSSTDETPGERLVLEVLTPRDLRAEVGSLAARQGWVLSELSWQRPTLENLFARIALELDAPAADGEQREREA